MAASGGCDAANELVAELAVPCPRYDSATSGCVAVAGVSPVDSCPAVVGQLSLL
jgi:hypothetical protein